MIEEPALTDAVRFRAGPTSKNRVALAPLTNQQSGADGVLSAEEAAWLVRRARGGFGVVTTCAAYVDPGGQAFDGQLGVATAAQCEALAPMFRDIAAHGALSIVQLHHGGVRAPSRLTGAQPVSASGFTLDEEGFEVPRALTGAEIEALGRAHVDAATRVVDAGAAGVELHAAHGYLLSQFLSRTMNTREDGYGGEDLAARYRWLGEIVREVRRAIPSAVLGVRLSPEDAGFARGLDLHESLEVARRLADDGVDYVHVSLWDVKRMTKKEPSRHPLPMFRAALPSEVVLFAAGAIGERALAEATLSLGADMLAIGRAAIINPDWARRVVEDGWVPDAPPLTPEQYAERAVSPRFVDYLRRFRGMVA